MELYDSLYYNTPVRGPIMMLAITISQSTTLIMTDSPDILFLPLCFK